MSSLDLASFEVVTFDCYGTLIDWEAGILAALRPVMARSGRDVDDETLLEWYGAAEAGLEAGPYRPYREILARALDAVAASVGVTPAPEEWVAFGGSVADWPAFADARAALAELRHSYRLGVITNCDDDLFDASNDRLGRPFEWVVTAAQARAYKPAPVVFEIALARIGVDPARILHVAQSRFHDVAPARALGLATVWLDRRGGRPGAGATPPATATADLRLPDLASLAALVASREPSRRSPTG